MSFPLLLSIWIECDCSYLCRYLFWGDGICPGLCWQGENEPLLFIPDGVVLGCPFLFARSVKMLLMSSASLISCKSNMHITFYSTRVILPKPSSTQLNSAITTAPSVSWNCLSFPSSFVITSVICPSEMTALSLVVPFTRRWMISLRRLSTWPGLLGIVTRALASPPSIRLMQTPHSRYGWLSATTLTVWDKSINTES